MVTAWPLWYHVIFFNLPIASQYNSEKKERPLLVCPLPAVLREQLDIHVHVCYVSKGMDLFSDIMV